MRRSQIEVRPIAGAIGAEIHNVDVSKDLDEGTIPTSAGLCSTIA